MSTKEQELAVRIEELVERAPESRHSYFQLKYFVIGKEPTLQAQMWQCLRELQARKDTIDGLALEIQDVKDQIELSAIQREKERQTETTDTLDAKIKEINLRRLDRQEVNLCKNLIQLDSRYKFAIQEARFFAQAFESLEKIEPMKDFDDLDAQKEYWNEVISQKINLKMLLQQPLDTELVQTALALHEDAPVKTQITQMLDRIQLQLMRSKEKKSIKEGDEKTIREIVSLPADNRQ